MTINGPIKLNVQVMREHQPAMGPGKALVLEAITEMGSISAAGRHIGMSYRRIWLLVDALNRDFQQAVVVSNAGGGDRGGTRLTPFGKELLTRYRTMERAMMDAAAGDDRDWLIKGLASSA